MEITSELKGLIQRFWNSQNTDSFIPEHQVEHQRRISAAGNLLQPERIPYLTHEEIAEFLQDTDAWFGLRWNKPEFWLYVFGVADAKLPALRQSLAELVQRAESGLTAEDIDTLIKALPGIGPSYFSEILALRFPDRYWMWNKQVQSFLESQQVNVKDDLPRGKKSHQGEEYLAAGRHLNQLREALQGGDGQFPVDYMGMDLFIYWVNQQKKAPKTVVEEVKSLAEPFSYIFADREEAEWAFDFLKDALDRLGIADSEDKHFSLTVVREERILRLNYASWAVLQFYGVRGRLDRVGIALFEDSVDLDADINHWERFMDENGRSIRVYELPAGMARNLSMDLRRAYEDTFDYIARRFSHWKASPFHRFHQPEIAEAVFNRDNRAALFSRGLRPLKMKFQYPDTDPEILLAAEKGDDFSGKLVAIQELYPVEQMAAETGFKESILNSWLRAIERKGQAILYGPPGTGKTYLAERLAKNIIGGEYGFFDLVQFHPAYAYEDFVSGLRPRKIETGGLDYPQVPGRFLEFCEEAQKCQGRCVLIIDEINRANLARVFGELMYLLEYRDREIFLAGGQKFSIPPNVRIIGTMNTADRSIALVDHALRRRFAFLALYPDYDVLSHYHQGTGFAVKSLIDVLKELNQQIGDFHYQVGITFFLRERLAEQLPDIWKMELEPYLEEYFFDQPSSMDKFRWEKLASRILP